MPLIHYSKRKSARHSRILLLSSLLLQLNLNQAFIPNIRHNAISRRDRSILQSSVLSATATADGDYYVDNRDEQGETYKINLQIAEFASRSSPRNRYPAREASDLLRSQDFPDTVGYNSVLKAWAKTSSTYNEYAAREAQDLLREMEELYLDQLEKNQNWYNLLEQEKLSEEQLSWGSPRIRVKPNFRSYSTVMDAWARQMNPTGAERAHELLEKLKELYRQTADVALQPNVISFNTVINGWAKAGAKEKGAIICEELLKDMGDLADAISYNAVLHAWAKSGVSDAGERAERLLRSMKTVKPNARTYNTVMHAWSRSYESKDSARRAHILLKEMENLAASDPSMAPECISYSTVVNAYALSKAEPLKAHKAFGLLRRMNLLARENPKVRPNGVTYNSVLNACATSCPVAVKDRLEQEDPDMKLPSLPEMVRTIYKQLLTDENLEPDHFTFGTVLKAVANLFWGELDQVEFGKSIFKEACRRGQVSFGVLSQLRQAVPVDVFRELLPSDALSPNHSDVLLNHIPKAWTCNVREENRRRNHRSKR